MKLDELYLLDIIEAADDIQQFIAEIDEEKFVLDKLIQSAVLFKLYIMGQTASKVSQKLKDRYEGIPWDDIMSYRDFTLHPQGVAFEKVWTIAVVDTPDLHYAVRDILKKEFNKG